MQREIKFRGFNTTTKKMIDLQAITPLALNTDLPGLFLPKREEVLLMQYTGLKDKNSKEIYEGDIIKNGPWKNDIHVITPLERGSFGTKDVRGHNFIISVLNSHCEIIGNIHENPELLEGK